MNQLEVEASQVQRPTGLVTVEFLSCHEVLQVLVVCSDFYWMLSSFQKVTSLFQNVDDSKHLCHGSCSFVPPVSCQTAVQAIKVTFFTIITRITSSRDEFGPPEISIRCAVVDSSTPLEQQSSGCDHHYRNLIEIVQRISYQIYNRTPLQSALESGKDLRRMFSNRMMSYLGGSDLFITFMLPSEQGHHR